MATRTIQIENKSGSSKNYLIYIPRPFILKSFVREANVHVWRTCKGVLHGGSKKLVFENDWYVYWGTKQSTAGMKPTIKTGGSALVDPNDREGVTFSHNNRVTGLPNFGIVSKGMSGSPDSCQIKSDPITVEKEDNYVFGIAKQGRAGTPCPVATYDAYPNFDSDIGPLDQEYILVEGNFTEGEIIDLKSLPSAHKSIMFDDSNKEVATVIQDEAGSFSVVYS